ncbi:hypothetical protein [Nocardioides sp. 1609]|uniref:hypothetical protein n=1 Tax=Nocardioides sp. 1609 TaxID=2508327 RepID=UPI00106F67A9|nr:hypothetical protein [Nocardioides sp. 1609]
MSCLGFLTEQQRAALAASSSTDAAGVPLSAFTSPPASDGKTARVRALAASADPRIRESAALSYRAPDDVLVELAGDADAAVRRCVARNERTPVAVLHRLVDDPDPFVRGWVAAHPAVPSHVLDRLGADPDAAVRAVVTWARGWA